MQIVEKIVKVPVPRYIEVPKYIEQVVPCERFVKVEKKIERCVYFIIERLKRRAPRRSALTTALACVSLAQEGSYSPATGYLPGD